MHLNDLREKSIEELTQTAAEMGEDLLACSSRQLHRMSPRLFLLPLFPLRLRGREEGVAREPLWWMLVLQRFRIRRMGRRNQLQTALRNRRTPFRTRPTALRRTRKPQLLQLSQTGQTVTCSCSKATRAEIPLRQLPHQLPPL